MMTRNGVFADRALNFAFWSSLVLSGIAVGAAIAWCPPLVPLALVGSLAVFVTAFMLPEALIILLLAPTPFYILWQAGGLSPVEAAYVVTFGITLFAWMLQRFLRGYRGDRVQSVNSPVRSPILALLLLAFLGATHAELRGKPFQWWASDLNIILGYAIYFVVAGVYTTPKKFQRLLNWMYIISALSLARALYTRLNDGGIFYSEFGSVVPHLSQGSSYTLITFAITVTILFKITHKHKEYSKYLILAGAFGAQQILAGNRSRWMACIGMLGLLFLVVPAYRKYRFVKLGSIIAFSFGLWYLIGITIPVENGFLQAPVVLTDRFASVFEGTQQPTVKTRLSEWDAVLELANRHPVIGNGLGNQFMYLGYDSLRPNWRKTRFVHNSFYWYYLTLGALGIAVLLWLCVAGFVFGISLSKRFEDPYWRGVALGLTMAFVAIVGDSFLGSALSEPGRTIWVGTILGLLAALNQMQHRINGHAEESA
ncbi:MAG: O-antigen ligase family protein [Candidatus Omnitrophica bacterium]|nr:O-antigen ligase family protein [Candidatus Omnitrophota bacterium]